MEVKLTDCLQKGQSSRILKGFFVTSSTVPNYLVLERKKISFFFLHIMVWQPSCSMGWTNWTKSDSCQHPPTQPHPLHSYASGELGWNQHSSFWGVISKYVGTSFEQIWKTLIQQCHILSSMFPITLSGKEAYLFIFPFTHILVNGPKPSEKIPDPDSTTWMFKAIFVNSFEAVNSCNL